MMKTETYIKEQARAALRGNMSKLLAAAGVAALAFLLLEYLEYLVLLLFGVIDADTEKMINGKEPLLISITVIYTGVMVLASPLLNGFVRMAAEVAVKKDCQSPDVFYYFQGGYRYFKTVVLNLLLFLMFFVASSALNISGFLQMLAPDLFNATPSLSAEGFLTVFAGILTAVLRVLIYMLLVHYPLFSYAFDERQSVAICAFGTIGFSVRHFWQLFRLMLSFAGWFALCFFVVPALYVLPYFAVAAANSARWLFELDRNGGSV